eukprot:CAMPEP_0172540584 /NCGR_PEP_ID=MMETSP1067-20121228/11567_1 /TAXON_ID=265564 ORGANISM="Thalassiosira punctigera, Strain Tpunct2005C2" /NCGR_SAMPLE_ID=MMETSP1067 /ASSEMBLY_ACC=CAM_ASM_000444 /LENGTH=249 /DNA_ID=CAMNT_0013326473 /DNA_START=178 /DNA_END=923 /DNA_ORIENTATION=+
MSSNKTNEDDDDYETFLSVLNAPSGSEHKLLGMTTRRNIFDDSSAPSPIDNRPNDRRKSTMTRHLEAAVTEASDSSPGTTNPYGPVVQEKGKMADGSAKKDEEDDKYKGTKPVSFFALFRHGSPEDVAIMVIGIILQSGVGFSFAAMNLVFGEMIDDLSSPAGSIVDSTSGTIRVMLILAGVFGAAAFVAMSFLPWGAVRITQRVRNEYVNAVLRQDMAFFDESKPGEVVAALSDYTMDFEEGLSTKLG